MLALHKLAYPGQFRLQLVVGDRKRSVRNELSKRPKVHIVSYISFIGNIRLSSVLVDFFVELQSLAYPGQRGLQLGVGDRGKSALSWTMRDKADNLPLV